MEGQSDAGDPAATGFLLLLLVVTGAGCATSPESLGATSPASGQKNSKLAGVLRAGAATALWHSCPQGVKVRTQLSPSLSLQSGLPGHGVMVWVELTAQHTE